MRKWTAAIAAMTLAGAMLPVLPVAAQTGAAAQATVSRTIEIDAAGPVMPRNRMAQMSVGSDFPGTLIRDDSLAQLRIVQQELRFKYIRFHNVFADDLGIYREVDGKPVYDWTKLDRLYDRLLGMGLKPFVELGFTPDAMKTSNQTLFYWKGNTSHPQPDEWTALVDAYVRHMIARYSAGEVRSWYFEFWNEPNLKDFWEGGDQKAYFDYYARTVRAIKAIDPALRVGGPSTAGAAWVPEFLAYAKANDLPVDFITTHTYGVDSGFLDETGQTDIKLSRNPDGIIHDVRRVRQEIEAAGRPGMPLFFTEWSSSYSPRDPIHDDYLSAAYILSKLRRSEPLAQGMSYWTFSDLFEEPGPQTRAFDGGFGLMTPDGIRKPAWFAFKYLNELGDREIATKDDASIATVTDNGVQLLAWRDVLPEQPVSNRPFFTKVREPAAAAPLAVRVAGLTPGRYRAAIRRTGFRQNDAYTAYLDMGRPEKLTPAQLRQLQSLTIDKPETRDIQVAADGRAVFDLPMRDHDVVMIDLTKR